MPQGKLKDAILEKMIDSGSSAFRTENNFKNYQPEMVFSWIDSMNDEEKKLSYVNKYLSYLEEKSPSNALQWVKHSTLSNTQKKNFTKEINSHLSPDE